MTLALPRRLGRRSKGRQSRQPAASINVPAEASFPGEDEEPLSDSEAEDQPRRDSESEEEKQHSPSRHSPVFEHFASSCDSEQPSPPVDPASNVQMEPAGEYSSSFNRRSPIVEPKFELSSSQSESGMF